MSLLSSAIRRRVGVLVAGLVVASAAAGCAETRPSESAEETPATHVVSSKFGEVTLPVEPKAALGMYTTDVDILITLGMNLAKEQPIRGDGYTTFPSFGSPDMSVDEVRCGRGVGV